MTYLIAVYRYFDPNHVPPRRPRPKTPPERVRREVLDHLALFAAGAGIALLWWAVWSVAA